MAHLKLSASCSMGHLYKAFRSFLKLPLVSSDKWQIKFCKSVFYYKWNSLRCFNNNISFDIYLKIISNISFKVDTIIYTINGNIGESLQSRILDFRMPWAWLKLSKGLTIPIRSSDNKPSVDWDRYRPD